MRASSHVSARTGNFPCEGGASVRYQDGRGRFPKEGWPDASRPTSVRVCKGGKDFFLGYSDKWPIEGFPLQAVRETQPDASVLYVPPPSAADAIIEAIENEIGLIVCITEGIPQADEIRVGNVCCGPQRRLTMEPTATLGRECPQKPVKVAPRWP
jgi:CoA binding domain